MDLSAGTGDQEQSGPLADRSFYGPELNEFNPIYLGVLAFPKEVLHSLHIRDRRLPFYNFLHRTRRMVQIESPRRYPIPCSDLIRREDMTIVPRLLR